MLIFPASLEVIEEKAFSFCRLLRDLTFATGSRLQCIHREAFANCPIETVILPANVQEVDPFAFDPEVWQLVKFDGPPHVLITDGSLCSADSHILLRSFSGADQIAIPSITEVIGPGAFAQLRSTNEFCFESGTRLNEIGERAFEGCQSITEFIVPSSVETIGDRCFEGCCNMTVLTFEGDARLKRIGERAFAKSGLSSIAIPASTQEIDGSAFVDCPIVDIGVAPGSRNFVVEGNLLLTADMTKVVRFFGRELEAVVPGKVEIVGKSSFEECRQVERILFENESKLRIICRSALSNCTSLRNISIPASVEVIDEAALTGCNELESCLIAESANLRRIGKEAFAGCQSLRLFYISRSLKAIGENCFSNCVSLRRLRLVSGETLKRLIGDLTLDEALDNFGFDEIMSLLKIEIEGGGGHSDFPGWSSVVDEGSHLTLIQDIP
jgi:hypothetical protein